MENNLNTRNMNIELSSNKMKKKKSDINFRKWLLCLSQIGNLILGSLLIIMGIQ
jgi:hypothetical protein